MPDLLMIYQAKRANVTFGWESGEILMIWNYIHKLFKSHNSQSFLIANDHNHYDQGTAGRNQILYLGQTWLTDLGVKFQ